MDIIWHGHSCFTLKGKQATLVTDPYEGLGTSLPKLKADVVTLGDALAGKKGKAAAVEGEPKTLDWPGEFEVSGVSIEGFSADLHATEEGPSGENAIIFVFIMDGVKICHMSGLSHDISDELIDRIGDVDLLLLPVGGGDVLSGKEAHKLMEAIEPRVVIPMYFDTDAREFLKAVGKTELKPLSKFSIQGRGNLPEGNMEFILLEPQN